MTQQKKTIKVRKKSQSKTNSTDIHLLVAPESRDELVEWDRNKIVEQLMAEANIGEKTAIEISKIVEERVFDSKLDRISSSLIRELVDNELFERGLQKKLEKQKIIGMPKHDIESLIFNKSLENSNISVNNPESIGFSLAETIMKQYALQNVFSPEVADAHKTGAIHLHDLGAINRVYAFSKNTTLMVKCGEIIKEMNLIGLWEHCDCEPKQINETQLVKNVEHFDLYVLDKNKWVKLQRIIISNEIKKMYTFDLHDGSKVCVTEDHGCVVKRDGRVIIVRADEVKNSDKFLKV
jgi:hypothetical protein